MFSRGGTPSASGAGPPSQSPAAAASEIPTVNSPQVPATESLTDFCKRLGLSPPPVRGPSDQGNEANQTFSREPSPEILSPQPQRPVNFTRIHSILGEAYQPPAQSESESDSDSDIKPYEFDSEVEDQLDQEDNEEDEEAVSDGDEAEEETSHRQEAMAAVRAPTPNGDPMSDNDPPPQHDGSNDEDDLFGDDDEEPQLSNEHARRLDDEELDSGDDEGRRDRLEPTVEDEDEDEGEFQEMRSMNVKFARIPPPVGDEMYLLNMPPFLGLNHRGFHPTTYQPPEKPHDDRSTSTTKFSPYDTAMSTLYWRRDPKQAELLQSNSRIIRWSDGSLTLQVASDPTKQYSLTTTPLHQNYSTKSNSLISSNTAPYDPTKDSNNYLVAPHGTVGYDFQITRPLDAALKVNPTADQDQAAILRLEQSLKKNASSFDPFANVKTIRVDPERAKRDAEKAEKEIAAQLRKQANARDRLDVRKERVLGRSGFGSGRGGGLSVAGLEDDDGMPSARGTKSKTGAARRPKRNRRGSIYSDDEDENMPRGRTREDEYDREDDFLAASDEELETYDDDGELPEDDEDEDAEGEIDDEPAAPSAREKERLQGRSVREGTPKRPAEDEADAGVLGSPQARKKRRVIDDDEDDE